MRHSVWALGALCAVLIAYAAGSSMTPGSVLVTELGKYLAKEVQICCPGVECRNQSLVCGKDYICVLRTTSPTPSYTGTPTPSETPGLTPVPSKSYVPSESPMDPLIAQSPLPSAILTECNSCHTHTDCVTGVCHMHKCIFGGHRMKDSMTKCGLAKANAHASHTPNPTMPPVVLAWV